MSRADNIVLDVEDLEIEDFCDVVFYNIEDVFFDVEVIVLGRGRGPRTSSSTSGTSRTLSSMSRTSSSMSRTSKSRTEDFDLDNFEEDLVFEVLYMRTARTRSNTSFAAKDSL